MDRQYPLLSVKQHGRDFPPLGKWEQADVSVSGQDDPWDNNANGETLLSFDCPCNTAEQSDPNWENLPYDIHIEYAGGEPETCPRCGRLFKLEVAWRVVCYTPVAVRYPKQESHTTMMDGSGRPYDGRD